MYSLHPKHAFHRGFIEVADEATVVNCMTTESIALVCLIVVLIPQLLFVKCSALKHNLDYLCRLIVRFDL